MARRRHARFRGSRRDFLKQSLTVAGGAAALPIEAFRQPDTTTPGAGPPDAAPDDGAGAAQQAGAPSPAARDGASAGDLAYPRVFSERQLSMIAFPLGGLAAGSISLGGRGQLRDWEIFNRPDKGNAPEYAFPAIWVKRAGAALRSAPDAGARAAGDARVSASAGASAAASGGANVAADGAPAIVRVLEARLQPPYEGPSGLGSRSAPGLQRLAGASFSGEYPFARVAFHDPILPVSVTLEAFSPFVPHEADDSGLPATVLRYRVKNDSPDAVDVSIAWAIENMLRSAKPRPPVPPPPTPPPPDTRVNEHRREGRVEGLLMRNPGLDADDPMLGTFGLWLLDADAESGSTTYLRGWTRARWWTSVLRYWDDLQADGRLGPEASEMGAVGALCLRRHLAPGAQADYTFMLTWCFPNRTPERCGWEAPEGQKQTVIGNHYATRFDDAWSVARYAAANLDRLEQRTRQFVDTVRDSTIPGAIKDAAMANLSTLATQTVFRTADGEFHGFEGCNDKSGCCMGNCTHVWNYETTTAHLFPAMSRSLRRAAFGYSLDDDGRIRIRQLLPDGIKRFDITAADGHMGQIIKVCMDWKLSGDDAWLATMWPGVKRALAFAWLPGGWDADRDGVLEGVQHNTYDVEFYGPNPQCGIYYLGALRAAEVMARAMHDARAADDYRQLFDRGRAWIDRELFNGEYYVQHVRGVKRDLVRPALLSTMGSDESESPQYQIGDGCLVDQLVGQYLADVTGLGPLVSAEHCRRALESIYRYNRRTDLFDHACLQRTYAVNDEAALLVCDYGKGTRPEVPFPYYAEVWTGLEYTVAAHMIYAGMTREGLECVVAARARHDGLRRNPWNEPECGHHYARAMSAWSCLLAASGFRYDGAAREIEVRRRSWAAGDISPRVAAREAASGALASSASRPVGQQAQPTAESGGTDAFRSFWSSGTGWGTFAYAASGGPLTVTVLYGTLPCRALRLVGEDASAGPTTTSDTPARGRAPAPGGISSVRYKGAAVPHEIARLDDGVHVKLRKELTLREGEALVIQR